MTRVTAIAIVLVLAGSTAFESSVISAQAGGWTTLFDGKTLKGWNLQGNANWEVVDGVIQATSGNGNLVSTVSLRRRSDRGGVLGG